MRRYTVLFLLLASPLAAAPVPEGDGGNVAEFAKALQSRNATVRKQAALALGEMGPKAKAAVAALREALLDKDESVQAAAAEALERIEPRGKPNAGVARELEALKREAAEMRARADAERARALAERDRADASAQEARRAAELARAQEARARVAAEAGADELKKLQATIAQLRDARVQAEINAKALQERNERLQVQIEDLAKELARLKAAPRDTPAPNPQPRNNPPAENVEGKIKAVDKTGLVTLTIGSDAGLAKGHTLEVFRLKPQPKYLGTIRIVEVRPTEAIGMFVGRAAATPEVGDSAASRIRKE